MASSVWNLRLQLDECTRWNLRCDSANALLNGLLVGVAVPFVPLLAVRAGASNILVGLMLSALFLPNLLSPLWAYVTRGRSPRQVYVVATVIYRVGLGLIGFLQGPIAIALAYIGIHVFLSASNPAYGALVHGMYPEHLRGRMMATVRVTLATGMLFSTLIAGMLIDEIGIRWLLGAVSLLGVIGGFIGGQVRPRADESEVAAATENRPQRTLLVGWAFAVVLLALCLFHGSDLMVRSLYSTYQVHQLAVTGAQAGLIAMAWNGAWLVAFAAWGRIVDRYGGLTVLVGAAICYAGAPIIYAVQPHGLGALLAASVCQGVADAALDLGLWQVVLAGPRSQVASRTAAAMLLSGLRAALFPIVGSLLFSHYGYAASFGLAIVPVVGGLAILLPLWRRLHITRT